MSQDTSLLAKLLVTRMCHDLAGPLGGISNGVEFLSESAGNEDTLKQSLSLLALSSGEGSAKLQVFRQAYGIINQIGETTEIALIRDMFDAYFKHSKISVSWDVGPVTAIDHRTRQILFNLVLVAASTLIMGGVITIALQQEGKTAVKVGAEGQQIKCDKTLMGLLNRQTGLADVTPQTVPAYFAALLAAEQDSSLQFNATETTLSLLASNLP